MIKWFKLFIVLMILLLGGINFAFSDEPVNVNVKIYNENSGELVNKYDVAPGSLTAENMMEWTAGIQLPKGAYRFQVIAEDDLGNQSVAYASCVKDGIAPVISFPSEDNQEISGIIAVRGTAMDPDWTNSKPFKDYRIYYAQGKAAVPFDLNNLGPEWKSDAIEVPLTNRGQSSIDKNLSLRPLQNDSTLAYLYTNALSNGTYTILAVVDEDGGDSIATARVIEVNNDPLSASNQNPFIRLSPIANEINYAFDNSVKLPIRFLNSVKPSNVYLEIISMEPRRLAAGSSSSTEPASEPRGSVVFSKYFPNLAGAPFIGKPDYKSGTDLGYFIWEDDAGWHIRWSSNGSHHFTGNVIAIGGTISVTGGQGSVKSVGNMLSWDASLSGGEGGFDFTVADGKQLMITPKIDEDPSSPSPYASNVYLGVSKASIEFIPLMIDLENQQMIDLASMASGGGSDAGNGGRSASNGIDWDGKLDTGGFADDGNYIVRVRAEGCDGFGLATDEARIKVSTPFEISNIDITNKTFSPVSAPDRVSIHYNVSKDSLISAYVYDENNNLKTTLIENEKIIGVLNPNNKYTISWRGNYPDSNSSTIVTGGKYYIKLIARAQDGSDEKTQDIKDISIVSYSQNSSIANLDPIGDETNYNGDLIRLAKGESPFYFEAKGSGLYYPPKDFNYTLTASGQQRFTTYPYVPFAALVHRGFRQVDLKFKIYVHIDAYYMKKEWGYKNGQFNWWEKTWNGFDEIWDADYSFKEGEGPLLVTRNYEAVWRRPPDIAGNTDVGAITGARITRIEVFAGRDTFHLDDAAGLNISINNGDYVQFGKGILKTKVAGTVGEAKNYTAMASIDLASEIPYSRLTNRFVPWVDFVNKNHSAARDFSAEFIDIQKGLGFPGNLFFNDSGTKLDAPYMDKNTVLSQISSATDWKDKIAALNALANTSSLLGYKDSLASTVGYDKYLSNEYFEFIPITVPEGGEFEKKSDTNYLAKTNLAMYQSPLSGQSQTPFVFSWPNPDLASWEATYGTSGKNYKALVKSAGGDPQKWDGYGDPKNTCFYELDQNEINSHAQARTSYPGTARVMYYKDKNKSEWTSGSLSSLLDPGNYFENLTYGVSGISNGVRPNLVGTGRNGHIYAEDTSAAVPWDSSDDSTLYSTSGLIKSGFRLFNSTDFKGLRPFVIFGDDKNQNYKVSSDYTSNDSLKYTFLKKDLYNRNTDSPCDNPNLVINKWDISIKDRTGQSNADLEPGNAEYKDSRMRDLFDLKLKTNSSEKRYVEIKGSAVGPYELVYFDGQDWQNIATSYVPKSGTLAWWNVSRLNGKYTVLLKCNGNISTKDIYIGTMVKHDGNTHDVFSAYCRAQLTFSSEAFAKDQLATITPVTMSEIKINNKPIIMTHGPIVEIKPSPIKFKTPQEDGIDTRPTLKFYYTLDDLNSLGITPDKLNPTKNLGLNIHQITSAGDLQVISDNHQDYDPNNKLYCFWGTLDHFSDYVLTKGKFKLSAPIVLADRYITNKDTVTIYGTADAGSQLELEVYKEPPRQAGAGSVPTMVGEAGEDGRFSFNNVKLLQEGENYIYVFSHPKGNPDIKTQNDVMVIKDTVPPTVEAYANLKIFSPNGDGKYDTVEYDMRSNEKGKLGLMIMSPDGKMLVNQELLCEANQSIKLAWGQYGFNIYKRDSVSGDWLLMDTINASSVFSDGEYSYTVYAIDEAGNISNNLSGKTILDTAPPKILRLNAAPNPFTPNDDGVNDTTTISYSLNEACYVTAKIMKEDGGLFRKHSEIINGKSFAGGWEWDGRGARNELLGGTYSYYIDAEDYAGNASSSEVKTIVVDRAPSLIPYAYADPDPFSPVNPKNNYTEVKYYLSRDNLQVQAVVLGYDDKPIKNLVFGETQNKGEHTARWYGDFIPSYQGPRASSDTSKVSDGSYQFKVIAVDPAGGKPAEVSNTVLVDNVAPHITINPVKVDYVSKTATLTYAIPETSSVEVSVYNLDGNLVRTIDSGIKPPGTYHLDYSRSGAGYNYFKLRATDPAKNEDEQTTEIFSVTPAEELTLANVAVSPSPFTPNSDGIKDQTRIFYQLSGGAPEYSVNIDILNAGGAIVRHLISNDPQNPGSYSFYWDGNQDAIAGVRSAVKDGIYAYRISIEDKLGDKVESIGNVTLVSTKPTINLSLNPDSIAPQFDYSVDYPVAWITNPALVKLDILNASGEAVFTRIFNHTPGSYSFVWDGKDNNQMPVEAGQYYYVYLNATDALGTPALPQSIIWFADTTASDGSIIVDKNSPVISNATYSANPAKAGNVNINFSANESLKSVFVKVTQNGAGQLYAPVANLGSGNYQATYNVFSGYDGPAMITIEASDLASNISVYSLPNPLIVDTIAPTISSVSCEVNNLDFSKFAKEGLEVTIRFKVSEPLQFNPEVKINSQLATYSSQLSTSGETEYVYKYSVSNKDIEGLAEISISAVDPAGNIGEKQTSTEAESFVIDLTNPTVWIAEPSTNLIANPSPFQTNADPTDNAVHRQTTLYYSINEYGRVSVKVYKINNTISADALTRNDFTSNKLIGTLVDGQWLNAGNHEIPWHGEISVNGASYDTNNDKFADPGKYAFIVEVQDKAGNVVERMWGGTVWVQNNVLKLVEPEGRSSVNNPDPKYISPNGNSTLAKQRQTRIWFEINLGVTPKAPERPERISLMSVTDDISWEVGTTKTVGYYSVKVYDLSNNLMQTIADHKVAESGKLLSEIWDGKNSTHDQFAPEGTYKIIVDVKDYTNGDAIDNYLTRTVVVDNTPPTIPQYSINNYYFSPGNPAWSLPEKETTTISYEVKDNEEKIMSEIDILSGSTVVCPLQNLTTLDANAVYQNIWDGTGAASDGKYTYKISVSDFAGNTEEATGEVVVDKTQPSGTIIINDNKLYTNSTAINLQLSWSDQTSGMENIMRFKNDGGSWSNWEALNNAKLWNITSGDGPKTVWVEYMDKAGNYGNLSDDIILDTVMPEVEYYGQASDTWYNVNNDITLKFKDNKAYSSYRFAWDAWPPTDQTGANPADNLTTQIPSEGIHSLNVRVWDQAGNRLDASKTYEYDQSKPNIGFSGQADNAWYKDNNAITISPSDTYSYRGFKWSWDSLPPNDPTGCDTSASINVYHPGVGTKTLYVRAWDWAGNFKDEMKTYKKDIQAPSITPPSDDSFNPYLGNGKITKTFSVSDLPSADNSGIYTVTAQIVKDDELLTPVRTLAVTNSYSITWDGTNDAGDYVNEGTYKLKITATDNAGNSINNSACSLKIIDNQYIADGIYPSMFIEGNLILRWFNGEAFNDVTSDMAKVPADTYPGKYHNDKALEFLNVSNKSLDFNIDHTHTVYFDLRSDGGFADDGHNCFYKVKRSSDDSWVASWDRYGPVNETVSYSLSPGTYYLWVEVRIGKSADANIAMTARYKDEKFIQYFKSCGKEYEDNIGGATTNYLNEVDSYSNIPTEAYSGNTKHKVSSSGGCIYYQRDGSAAIKIATGIDFGYSNPVVAADSGGNAYVAWMESTGLGGGNIYFQKVPSNFAPINGSVTASSINIKVPTNEAITQQSTSEAPTLLDPAEGKEVQKLRPTFSFKAPKDIYSEYRILWSQIPNAEGEGKATKQNSSGSETSSDPGNLNFAYKPDEIFDPALARNKTYYWKVVGKKLDGTEVQSSTINSFTCNPPFEISGITNYPNPFNSNKEKTKIRYKLSKDADDVKIRIYDITGALVAELDGTNFGEGVNIWSKYNDIYWDGRNGRGDLVLNGIYPFEVVATLNGNSVSGRGKIAVLK